METSKIKSDVVFLNDVLDKIFDDASIDLRPSRYHHGSTNSILLSYQLSNWRQTKFTLWSSSSCSSSRKHLVSSSN